MPYEVELDAFHGPLDLLLYLVKKEEVDVLEISISRLADQFLDYLRTVQELDVEFAGDFLVMAATLMEIKSRSLVPQAVRELDASEEADPRRELVRQLMEYRKFKDAATALEQKAEAHSSRLARVAPEEAKSTEAVPVRAVELWDLVSAFARILRETQATQPQVVMVDDTPQHVYEAYILDRLRAAGRILFRDLFDPPHTRARLIGLFLALLELMKKREVLLEQVELFGEIGLSWAGAALE
jgi:segregation and condensation protein A